jgi:class 3 adenylate cyclase/pimeloyl-ACP methyl ester carboxylesterase
MSHAALPIPETHYAKSGDVSIAYQVMGDGPIDLIVVPGIVSHVESFHEFPGYTDLLRRLASFARVVTFDKRGQGLSDRIAGAPTLDERMDDLHAVMNAVGASHAALFGVSEGASMSALFSATYPEKVSHLILCGGFARFSNCADYEFMFTMEQMLRAVPYWGTGAWIKSLAPSLAAEPDLVKLLAKIERLCYSPGSFKAMVEVNGLIDVRAILPQIRVPTLVLHRTTDKLVPVGNGRYLAAHIPAARYVEYPTGDHPPFVGDLKAICGDVEEFVTGHREAVAEEVDRVLATVLFTDIVESTRQLANLGDRAWLRLLDEHDSMASRLVEQHRGRLIKTTGDGILASFDGPGRAIRCAITFSEAAARMGLSMRAGLHTGEVELRGSDIAGIAVNAAARIMTEARPGEILVSRVVTDLVAGGSVKFAPHEIRELKGLPGRWDLFAATA